jgi:tripartite-type tricarboxylate transporter receptor subunit TctC
MALERGETEGYCGWAISSIRQRSPAWLKDNKLRFLAQFALKKDPDFPDVPLAMDLPPTVDGKRAVEFISADAVIAWPLMAPPDLPRQQVQILRTAFDAMLQDQSVLADAAKEGLAVDPVSGTELLSVVSRLYDTPPSVLEIVKKINLAR